MPSNLEKAVQLFALNSTEPSAISQVSNHAEKVKSIFWKATMSPEEASLSSWHLGVGGWKALGWHSGSMCLRYGSASHDETTVERCALTRLPSSFSGSPSSINPQKWTPITHLSSKYWLQPAPGWPWELRPMGKPTCFVLSYPQLPSPVQDTPWTPLNCFHFHYFSISPQ